jgi:hypothetical protein
MSDRSTESVIEARLREFLDGELRRAESEFRPSEPARHPKGHRRPIAMAFATVATLTLAVVFVMPRVAGPVGSAPAAINIGDDGLPLSLGGEPVIRGDAIARLATTGRFLAGGTLVLNTGPCLSRSERAQLGCGEDWTLVSGPLDHPSSTLTLEGAPAAPGFVRTSGAPTVIRVGAPSRVPGVLTVESIAWRQPTKGPIPESAAPPEGGSINEALVPDFVSVSSADGLTIAGYTPKRYVLGGGDSMPGTPASPPQDLPDPVYGDDLVTLVGHMVPDVGFVALGAAVPPVVSNASAGPSAPPSTAPSPDPSVIGPLVDCGRINPATCDNAILLARAAGADEVQGASRILVDDVCPPSVACDRLYPFDSAVVFVTVGPDTTGWVAFEVTGLQVNAPQTATRWSGSLPAHILDRLPFTRVALRTQAPKPDATGQVCIAASIEGTLIRDEQSGVALADPRGLVHVVVWPNGYSARADAGRLVVLDGSGDVVARVGDRVSIGGGEVDANGTWLACEGTTTLTP